MVLDTPYVDGSVRTGLGGRGSLFLFKRISEKEEPEFSNSEVWRDLVHSQQPLNVKSISIPLSLAGAYYGLIGRRTVGFVLSLVAVALAYWRGGKFPCLHFLADSCFC